MMLALIFVVLVASAGRCGTACLLFSLCQACDEMLLILRAQHTENQDESRRKNA
jgi:hypothetical protein